MSPCWDSLQEKEAGGWDLHIFCSKNPTPRLEPLLPLEKYFPFQAKIISQEYKVKVDFLHLNLLELYILPLFDIIFFVEPETVYCSFSSRSPSKLNSEYLRMSTKRTL